MHYYYVYQQCTHIVFYLEHYQNKRQNAYRLILVLAIYTTGEKKDSDRQRDAMRYINRILGIEHSKDKGSGPFP
jgi:hypothetical protein